MASLGHHIPAHQTIVHEKLFVLSLCILTNPEASLENTHCSRLKGTRLRVMWAVPYRFAKASYFTDFCLGHI